ncbi:cohesin domain-containing protein [Geomonas subterranea]|uniref:Tetratricopeptide repeat protein n=1 Tax=Geomonas subterranea TaxID=2847989 RepID=A0ABX8LK94_9BACT|nr:MULTISPECIES: cohesin domain-containing protein [Geomonas]QXE91120.1 tetratricopeptide repeat protein [Geomonas subterranea]QXM10793.1 tetratricopeptide repeat protein [Geomonas subterranea]
MHRLRSISTLILLTVALSGCAAGRTAFSKAEQLEREGNLDAALVKYAEVASKHPDVGEYRVKLINVTEAAAKVHFKRGEAFFEKKNYDEALREFESAYAMDPTYVEAKARGDQALKMRNALTYLQEGADFERDHKLREAMTSYQHVLQFQPDNKAAREGLDRILAGKKQKLDGFELNLKSTKPITLKFKDAKLKDIFNILTQLSGINFVFDEGVKDVNVSLHLENGSFQQAMELLTGMQKLDKKVLNESTIIIYPKTPDKIKQYEELFVQTFYLNKLDAKKAVNLVRTMLQVKKIYVNEEANALVIRDTPEVVEVARKILEANDVPDAEVLLEVEVFELSKKDSETFGMLLSRYATSLGVTAPGTTTFLSDSLSSTTTTSSTTAGTPTSTPTNISNLLNAFKVRGYNGWLTVPSATFNFGKTLSNGETLSNPKIRVKNREKAKFNVGTRVPITTTSSTSTGTSVNVQYVDVGVKVNAEPTIQLNNEVSIKLGLEVSSILQRDTIGTDQATTVVTIGTRNLDTVLSLKDGETSIIGGLIQKSKTNSKNKVFLLGDIPILGTLFSNTGDSNDKSELLLAITPRIVRGVTVPENDVAAFWSGREDEPSTDKPYKSFIEPEFADTAAPAKGAPAKAAPAKAAPVKRIAPAAAAPAAAAPGAPAAPAVPAVPGAPAAPGAAAPAAEAVAVPGAPAPATAAEDEDGVEVTEGAEAPAPATTTIPAETPAPAEPGAAANAAAAAKAATPAPAKPAASPVPLEKALLALSLPASVKLSDQFTVQINASGLKDLEKAVLVLSYDPKILEVVSQTEGALLKENGKPSTFQSFADKKKGEIWMSGSKSEGSVGNGVLAQVTFKAIGQGSTPLSFSNTSFTQKGGGTIAVTPFKSVVEVQ